jgi:thioredoxin 2
MASIILTCPNCQAKNRVPAARLDQGPRCGSCQQALRPSEPVEVDDATLKGLIGEATVPILADFWAPWCGPCRMVAPVLHKLAERYGGQALFVKVNTDENQAAGARHEISGIPALLLFSKGREVQRLVGAHPAPAIERLLGTVGVR